MPETQTAFTIRDHDPGKAHLGEFLPEIVRKTVFAVHIAELAEMGDVALAFHEIGGAVLQHLLIVI